MRLLIAALLIVAVPTQACSIFYEEFSQADVDGSDVLVNLGQDTVHIDLATGEQTTLVEQYFPRVGFAGLPIVGYQEGLGADCSGTQYVASFIAGEEEDREVWAEAFDVDANRVALVVDNDVIIRTAATWQEVARFEYPRGNPEGPFGGRGFTPVIASDGDRIAVSDAEANILVYNLQGDLLHSIDAPGDNSIIMDWHQGQLVVGARDADATDFWVFEDLATGAARVMRLETGNYGNAAIAAGDKLWLQHGDLVVEADDTPRQLIVPAGLNVGTIAADGKLALFLRDAENAESIHYGQWYERDAGRWSATSGAAPQWEAGPVWASTTVDTDSPKLAESPAPSLLLIAAGALLLARRYR